MDGATVPLLVVQSSVSPAGNAERVLRVGGSVHGGGCKHKCDKCNVRGKLCRTPTADGCNGISHTRRDTECDCERYLDPRALMLTIASNTARPRRTARRW